MKATFSIVYYDKAGRHYEEPETRTIFHEKVLALQVDGYEIEDARQYDSIYTNHTAVVLSKKEQEV